MIGRRSATFADMGMRDTLKNSVKRIMDRFSGEYSARSGEIREPPPPSAATEGPVKITRPKLNRPK